MEDERARRLHSLHLERALAFMAARTVQPDVADPRWREVAEEAEDAGVLSF
jgi:hypothetical protein